MPNTPQDEQRINAIRFLAVDAVEKAKSGHPGLPLGAAAAAYVLWTRHLRFNPRNPRWFNRDRFILSAGHGSALLYALLYLTGFELSLDDLKSFRQLESRTPGHPEYGLTPGVETTSGPLGQGLGNAVGMAIAEAHLGARYNRDVKIMDHYTYCLASDGDMMEGVAAEACSLAGHLKLGKLIVLYDDNKVTLSGPTSITFDEDVPARFRAYGWHTQYVEKANDVDAIDRAITAAKAQTDQPSLISIRTHIGFGSPKMDTYYVHGEPLGADGVRKTKENLGWPLEPDFYAPDDVLAWFRQAQKRGEQLEAEWSGRYAAWKKQNPELAATLERILAGKLPPNLQWPRYDAQNGNVATREAVGATINAIASDLPELVGGSADLDPSTKTHMQCPGEFQPGEYDGRNVRFGVREHAMGAAANGMALHGGILPFCATFFNFIDYMKPAMRLAGLTDAHVLYIMTHDSIFLGEDGPTHQPVEQLATLRATPNMVVIRPADSAETVQAFKCAIERGHGPVTLVLTRQKLPYLGDAPRHVERGAYVLRDAGGTPDVILIATGSEVSLAVAAADLLAKDGIKARVVSIPSWELFREQGESYRREILPPEVRARVSIEAASTLAWREWIGDQGIAIGIDSFGASAPAADLAKHFGFTVERVARAAQTLLTRV